MTTQPSTPGPNEVPPMDVVDLQRKLQSLPAIEQSKGVLSCYFGISPEAAFRLLRRWSSHHNRPVREIGEMIVAAAAVGPSNRGALALLLTDLNSRPIRTSG